MCCFAQPLKKGKGFTTSVNSSDLSWRKRVVECGASVIWGLPGPENETQSMFRWLSRRERGKLVMPTCIIRRVGRWRQFSIAVLKLWGRGSRHKILYRYV